ncbi:hypothetical protein F4821DRAFT_259561 [Hypoxylon rubiginosum]|uniref:Uncharacterized protein n=1 Tax=Hypoxylon rubiginosum TaxID=110542 RepID=A0ACC0D2L9_9PEZI|nr:hypothetical protein F4821DRAFT_259561 [Hypoxylon rubiginosum]
MWHDHIDSVGMILDRPKLFEITNDHFDWESFMEPYEVLGHIPSVKMAEYVISRGWKPPHNVLYDIGADRYLYKENRADLLKVMVRNGADVNAVDVEGIEGVTPLINACYRVNPLAIEALLELGADPNMTSPSKYCEPIGSPNRDLGRPIDMLLDSDNWQDDWLYPNWRKVAQAQYKSIKALIEHGAEISLPPGVQGFKNPVQTFLENIWALLCPPLKRVSIQKEEDNLRWDRLPVLRKVPLASEEDDVTVEQLLELLLAVDIRPLDKLCDIVLDSTAEYSEFAKGLRGKERLHAILPHVKTIHTRHEELEVDEVDLHRLNPCLYTIKWNDGNDKFEGLDEPYDKHLDYYKPRDGNGYLKYHPKSETRCFHYDVNGSIYRQFP